jgi:hypothetical protein
MAKTRRIARKQDSQGMGPAQIPVLALMRKNELEKSLFLASLESAAKNQ